MKVRRGGRPDRTRLLGSIWVIAVNTRCEFRLLDRGQAGGHAVLAEGPVSAERTRTVILQIALIDPERDPVIASSPNAGDHGPRLLAHGADPAGRPVCPPTLERPRSRHLP